MYHSIFGYPFSYITLFSRIYNTCNIVLLPHLLSYYSRNHSPWILFSFGFLRIIQIMIGLLSWRRGMNETWIFREKLLLSMHKFILENVCLDEKWKDIAIEIGMLSSKCNIVYDVADTFLGLGLSILVAWYSFNSLIIAMLMPFVSLGFCLPLVIWQRRKIQDLTSQHLNKRRKRHSTIEEIISNLRTVKLLAMEDLVEEKVLDLRLSEIQQLIKKDRFVAANNWVWHILPVFLTNFLVLIWYYQEFKCSPNCFGIISLIQTFSFPLKSIPSILNLFSSQSLAKKQIDNLISESHPTSLQIEKNIVISNNDQCTKIHKKNSIKNSNDSNDINKIIMPLNKMESIIEISNGSFSYVKKDKVLIEINLQIKKGSFIGICGSVGSGKSALLNAFLGEMNLLQGSYCFNSNLGIAFVPQYPWLLNDTIKNNITFGSKYDKNRFYEVLQLCELVNEIDFLHDREETITGSLGANLSGGQQMRIALARALYLKNTDILILDDVFANVDPTLQYTMFENIIFGSHKDKTRVLATHNLKLLQKADKIFILENGRIVNCGTYEYLMMKCPLFVNLCSIEKKKSDSFENLTPLSSQNNIFSSDSEIILPEKFEEKKKNISSLGNFLMYIFKHNIWLFIQYCLFSFMFSILGIISDVYIFVKISGLDFSIETVIIYLGTSVTKMIFLFLTGEISSKFFNRTSESIHNSAFISILRAKIGSIPFNKGIGEVITPLTEDIQIIDSDFKERFQTSINTIYQVLINSIVVIYFIPKSFPVLIMVIALHFFLPHKSKNKITKLEKEKIDLSSKITSQITESYSGADIIRSFKSFSWNTEKFLQLVNRWKNSEIEFLAIQQWSAFHIHFIAASLITLMSWISVNSNISNNTGKTALVITCCFNLLQALRDAGLIFQLLLQSSLSLGRLSKISTLDQEDYDSDLINNTDSTINGNDTPCLEFKNVFMKYSKNTPYILHDVSFKIGGKNGKRIGLIGRSGSGKTSILNCLWRLYKISSGSITINSKSIYDQPLNKLRQKMLCIVPQHPVAFEGNVRVFLDPEGFYSDESIIDALHTLGMKNLSPNSQISISGKNLSVGTKQLLSLCRVLLYKRHFKKKLILFLDEATAFIDQPTIKILQNILNKEFEDSTIVFIAHSLDSVSNFCDQVILMYNGKVILKDSPANAISAYEYLSEINKT